MLHASFHFPLHRYLSAFLCAGVRAMGLRAADLLPPPALLRLLAAHPLRVQVRTHTRTCTCTHACMCTNALANIENHTHTHTHTCAGTRSLTHVHAYMHRQEFNN